MVTVPSLVTVDREVSLDNFPFASPLNCQAGQQDGPTVSRWTVFVESTMSLFGLGLRVRVIQHMYS